jgi:hypothetical protein
MHLLLLLVVVVGCWQNRRSCCCAWLLLLQPGWVILTVRHPTAAQDPVPVAT